KKKEKEQSESVEKKDGKTIADVVKSCEKLDGLFTYYRDTTSGTLYMEIDQAQLNKPYIYFSQIANGVLEAGSFRGAYRGSKIFKIERFYDKIDFVSENTSSYFDPDNALKNAADANISGAIIASETIEAEEDGKLLIKADNLFLKETFSQIKPPRYPKQSPFAFKLGSLAADKTKVREIRNYPQNADFLVEYVYHNPSVLNGGSRAVTDARNVSIRVYHSIIAMPENDYQPRFDDPRVGYFHTQVTDMTSTSPTPYRDMIHRWHLVKKNPEQEISKPVEPITWWIENTTPVEFRETIKEAVLQWNVAFEKAGFKNAMEVKIQPDDAEWDAGDIRYNVLRWTSSPNPPFGGYGPSFVNPRTGQILGADIMLEFVYHTNRVKYDELFNLNPEAAFEMAELPGVDDPSKYCGYGKMMQHNTLFGQTLLLADGANDLEMEGLKKEAMLELIMHEVGHTLGLNHNMKASQLFSPAQLSDKDFIKGKALTGSVMDYLAINATRDRAKQGQYFSPTVGPYDEWAIEFGYKPVGDDKELESILARSADPKLMFGNDADDMRSSSRGIDPRVMIGDLSNDQVAYAIDRIELVNDMMKNLKEKYTKEGQSYHELRQAFYILSGQHAWSGNVLSRFIGGVYVDRAMVGQEGATKPYTPVAYADQQKAMVAISKYIFAPDAFDVPAELYNYLAMQRRGFNFFRGPEDPKLHTRVLGAQKMVLNHLLHPNTLQRVSDTELYGNEYDLAEFMTELNKAIFDADIRQNVNSFRQNLQLTYTKMLIDMLLEDKGGKYTN
ncbi:MAG: zinc-dependent metalloprotease, partial [Fulvivirga sp.]|nr:zinc-dependent metalloprotease [Fulvivirga sp.]